MLVHSFYGNIRLTKSTKSLFTTKVRKLLLIVDAVHSSIKIMAFTLLEHSIANPLYGVDSFGGSGQCSAALSGLEAAVHYDH